jgi:hypothetical protein
MYLLVGMIVRVAFRMGYHRDPSRFPNISLFKAEMRRRLWVWVVQLDLLSSSQAGLPKILQPSVYDVTEPRNLIDEDLYETMTELPQSRPETESTVMLYTLSRNRVLHVFSLIVDLTNSTTHPSYQDVLNLDSDLEAVYENLPSSMKAIRAQDFTYIDSRSSMRRLQLGLTYLQAKLMLHRPFLLLGRTDPTFEYSRTTCLDTALDILNYQRKIDRESYPGGKLWTKDWRVWLAYFRFHSIVNHHFLFATTVLALDLDRDLVAPIPPSQSNVLERAETNTQAGRREAIVEALVGAHAILMSQSDTSREARKVATAVRLVLRKAKVNIDNDSTTGEYSICAISRINVGKETYNNATPTTCPIV